MQDPPQQLPRELLRLAVMLINMASDLQEMLQNRLKELPPAVQNAIMSGHITEHMQELARTHKLHFDQWADLENEVIMTVMGFERAETLEKRIEKEVRISDPVLVHTLVEAITQNVFIPIRHELEQRLDRTAAQPKTGAPIEDMTAQILETARPKPPQNTETPVIVNSETQQNSVTETRPGQVTPDDTQPQQKESSPEQKAEKTGPTSGAYAPGKPSSERKEVHDDPYRESVE